MKRYYLFVLSSLSIIMALSSCNQRDYVYYESCYATTVSKELEGYPYYFVSDDSTKIFPLNHTEFSYAPNQDEKVLLQYEVKMTKSTESVYLNIASIKAFPSYHILPTSESDTLGVDGIEPIMLWYSGGVYEAALHLNIYFRVLLGTSDIRHSIYLSCSENATERVDEDGHLLLELHHDANNDFDHYEAFGSYSFILPDSLITPNVTGVKVTYHNLTDKALDSKSLLF